MSVWRQAHAIFAHGPERTDLLHGCYMERRSSENRKAPEPVSFRGLALVAGAGFEPATFGL